MGCRHPHPIEEHGSASGGPAAQVVPLGGGDSGEVERHEERTHPPRSALDGAGAGPDDGKAGLLGKGHRVLLAGEHPLVAIATRAHRQATGVRSGFGLSQSDGGDDLARDHAGEPGCRDLRVGVPGEDRARQRDRDGQLSDVVVGFAERFDHEAGRDGVQSESADLFGELDTEEAQSAHLAKRLAVESALALTLLVERSQSPDAELPRASGQGLLLIGEREVHSGAPFRIWSDNTMFSRLWSKGAFCQNAAFPCRDGAEMVRHSKWFDIFQPVHRDRRRSHA